HNPKLRVVLEKRTGNAMSNGGGLRVRPAAGDGRAEMEIVAYLGRGQRQNGLIQQHLGRKIARQRTAVDGGFSSPVGEAHAGRGCLATPGPQKFGGALAHRFTGKGQSDLEIREDGSNRHTPSSSSASGERGG